MDPVLPRVVVGRRNHTPSVRVASDHERLLGELGLLEFLDGRKESVEVQVRDNFQGTCQG
jgi:hypothetical protein